MLGPHASRLTAALPAGIRLAGAAEPAAAAIVTFLGSRTGSIDRQALLAGLRARLAPGAPLVVLDHNQPRAWWRRALGGAALACCGLAPSRARYPAARELAALGFGIDSLRFACAESVQLIAARRPCGAARECVEESGREPWR